ncbi:hypothetical protein NA57DRAFT_60508 [Rhizodiscina lignyota]|uniref:BTB domain-containing protein n=1 Tax=Rhizodiscina lignyota TaxID=1504668 RepID=A0A9P4M1B7_9PEZI|nr:hypothetical protein NA57DRAFT_60508 [Rhizodiscina lignyota]
MDTRVKRPLGIRFFFNTGEFSDLTVRCKGRSWKVHKIIVASKSVFFRNALNNGFHESNSNELDLSEDNDPDVIEQMLACMYEEDEHMYERYLDERPSSLSLLTFLAGLTGVADKYDIPKLGEAAAWEFRVRILEDRDAFCMEELFCNVSAIYVALPETDRRLRDPFMTAIMREYALLRSHEAAAGCQDVALAGLVEAVKQRADFAADIVDAFNRGIVEKIRPKVETRGYVGIACHECGREYGLTPAEAKERVFWTYRRKTQNLIFKCDGCLVKDVVKDWGASQSRL